MGGTLTVSERIIFHLNQYLKHEDKYEVPFDVTQDGISQACSISRAHAAIELKKLKSSGLIDERLSHVRRGKTRRKAYFLTPEGKSNGATIVQYVKDNGIDPMVDPSKVVPMTNGAKTRAARKSSPLPSIKSFYGREKEIASMQAAVSDSTSKIVCVKGIAGIGKTTLVAKVASDLAGQRVFWHSVKPWDVTKTLIDSLARFFSDNGCRKLSAYLTSGKAELGELSVLLNEELAENGFTFIFDDADASDDLVDFFMMFRHSSGSAKIIMTAEGVTRFYDKSDVVARNEVCEIDLDGLELNASLRLLEDRGIKGDVAKQLVSLTKGHPLSLEMITVSGLSEAKSQVSKFLEEKFYADLSDQEKSLLQFASVFNRPFPAEAIPKDLRQVRKGSMLREVAPGRFEIHSSLKSFVYDSMPSDIRTSWHSAAADYYIKVGDGPERLHHLIRANRHLESEIMMSRLGESLMDDGNVQQLWLVMKDFIPNKTKYVQSVTLLKAKVANKVGEYSASTRLLEELSGCDEDSVRAESLIELGKIRSKQCDLKQASKLFSEALDCAQDLPAQRAKALRGQGVIENKLGNFELAQDLLESSARDSMSVMDSKGMLLAHLELGNVFIGRGLYEEAISHFSKCAAGFGPVDLANVYVKMGIACAHLGKHAEARLHLENAVKLATETGQPRTRAYAQSSLSELLTKNGDPASAKEHCFSALEVFTELNDKLGMSLAYANLGKSSQLMGDFVTSEEYYLESLAAIKDVDAPRLLGMRTMELGLVLMDKGEGDRARRCLEDAKALSERSGSADLTAMIETALGRL